MDKFIARRVARTLRTPMRRMHNHLMARQVTGSKGASLDPVVQIDNFWMSGYVFPPHPHAGFSAVSYMLEESEGSFQNNDSAGLSVKIHPGDLHWTFAGRGIMHEEYPDKKGVVCRGLQIFINAPIKNKMDPPSVVRVTKNEQPIWKSEDGAVAVRVVTGEYRGVKSPASLVYPMTILDVSLAKGASFSVDLEANINAFILSHAGSGATGVDDEHPVGLDDAVVYERDQAAEGTNGIKVSAPTEDLKFILFAAVPLNEPIVSGGPFIGGSREQIEMYYAKFRNGEMGSMERSEDSY